MTAAEERVVVLEAYGAPTALAWVIVRLEERVAELEGNA